MKVDLKQSYLYAGKAYGPGDGVEVPKEVHDALLDAGAIEKPKRTSKSSEAPSEGGAS